MGGHFIQKCEHGVVVAQCRCIDPAKPVTIVDCPDDCGVRHMDEQIMMDLPFENAEADRLQRQYLTDAEGRFRGHDPYREL